MNLPKYLSENKRITHTILLAILVFSPIIMFIGIQNGIYPLVYLGLIAIILANITAALTK